MDSTKIQWFISVCEQLSKNPTSTSHIIEEYRETPDSLPISLSILQCNDLSSTISLNISTQLLYFAKFHCLNITQYFLFKHYSLSSLDKYYGILQQLYNIILNYHHNKLDPNHSYFINKLLQIYVSLIKRCWLDCTNIQHLQLVELSKILLSGTNNNSDNTDISMGILFMKTVIDEFSVKHFIEYNLPTIFHSKTKLSFETNVLPSIYSLIIASISITFQQLTNNNNNSIYNNNNLKLCLQVFNLLNSIISWDFDSSTSDGELNGNNNSNINNSSKNSNNSRIESSPGYNIISKDFLQFIIQESFITEIFSLFQLLKQPITYNNNNNNDSYDSYQILCLLEIKNLLLLITAIITNSSKHEHAPILNSNKMIDCIFTQLQIMIENNINNHTNKELSLQSNDYHDGNIRQIECELFLDIMFKCVQKSFINQLLSSSKFHPSLIILSNITIEFSKEILFISQSVINDLQSQQSLDNNNSNNNMISELINDYKSMYDTSIIETWRGNVLSLCLEIWSCILSNDNNLLNGTDLEYPIGSHPLIQLFESNGIMSIIQQIFSILFESMVHISSLESILSLATEEDQENELLESKTFDYFVSNICIIGRFSFLSSIITLTDFMSMKLIESNNYYVSNIQNNSNNKNDNNDNNIMCMIQLESIRFFDAYVARYIEPDSSNYSISVWENVNNKLLSLHAADFSQIMEMILVSSNNILQLLPLENDLISSVSNTIRTIAKTIKSNDHLQIIISNSSISSIAQFITNNSNNCRLNAIGLAAVFESMGTLFIVCSHTDYFSQLCTAMFNQISNLINNDSSQANITQIERILACLRGLARCPKGQDVTLHNLFDSSLPVLHSHINQNYMSSDVIIESYILLIRDYAEFQLIRLNNNSCYELYKLSHQLLTIFQQRLSQQTNKKHQQSSTSMTIMSSMMHSNNNNNLNQQEVDFKNDLCLYIIELLNHLSTKDFSFNDDFAHHLNRSFEQEVSIVLLYGLQVIIPFISQATIQSLPIITEKYFSFISYIVNSYIDQFIHWIHLSNDHNNTLDMKKIEVFQMLIQHLVNGTVLLDGATARIALQALQSIGMIQWKYIQGTQTIGFDPSIHSSILLPVMNELMEMILINPSTRPLILSWDRIDALANTLITFISLDNQQFQSIANIIIMKQPNVQIQSVLMDCFNKLTNDGGVKMNEISKQNRMIFVKNFRDFVIEIKSLTLDFRTPEFSSGKKLES
eukprot:gene10083-13549_t